MLFLKADYKTKCGIGDWLETRQWKINTVAALQNKKYYDLLR